ncbi:hypothetical protein [Amycolatopsis sp. 195334CR]|uniref:hypothetical protein n=1 Tax=Amycolatopsis sp. 195334CR TaxID=2814588 RepID=UPI001A90564B|nr:hypothetical protein [Amycolatopsis sp. 195334CR]MBN6034088.1 hypothetical protein [Amycolatopsis sp. 195334CR]
MRTKYRLIAMPTTVLVIVVAAAGCSTVVKGQTSPPSAPAETSQADTDPWAVFAGVVECDVLNSGLGPHGFPPARKETAGGPRGCISDKPKFGTALLNLDAVQGIDAVRGDQSQHFAGTVNDRRALLNREATPGTTGDCAIHLEVSATARANIGVALSVGTTDQACDFVQQVASAIEPMLPRIPD